MTVCLKESLRKTPYMHRIYIWFWPTLKMRFTSGLKVHKSTYAVVRCHFFAKHKHKNLLMRCSDVGPAKFHAICPYVRCRARFGPIIYIYAA